MSIIHQHKPGATNAEKKVTCDCDCHRQGWRVMHCVECCSLCYETYLDGQKGLPLPDKRP